MALSTAYYRALNSFATRPDGPGRYKTEFITVSYHAETGDVANLETALGSHPEWDGLTGGEGQSLLHLAAARGQRETVRLLLAKGAPADARDTDGATAVHWGAASGYSQVVDMLLL